MNGTFTQQRCHDRQTADASLTPFAMCDEETVVRRGADMILSRLLQDPPIDHPIHRVPREELLHKITQGPDDNGFIDFGHGFMISIDEMKKSDGPLQVCMISGLKTHADLNNRAVRVLSVVDPRKRVLCETMTSMQRISVKLDNLIRIKNLKSLGELPFSAMSKEERAEVESFMTNEMSCRL